MLQGMHKVFYPIVYFIVYLVSLMPLKVHYLFADGLAFLLHRIVRYRRKVVLMNLSRAFPDLKYWGIDTLVQDYYRYLADNIVETLWSLSATGKQMSALFEVEGDGILEEMVRKHGSVIVVMGHQGNWEFIASMRRQDRDTDGNLRYADIVSAYKQQSGRIADRLMTAIRMHSVKAHDFTGHVVESASFLRYVLKNRSEGVSSIYYMIADQSSPLPKLAVNFLNQKTVIFNGPEHIAVKTGFPVVFLEDVKVAQGKYRVNYRLIAETPKETAPGYISKTFMQLLEDSIRENRSSWLWSHRRWKYTFGRNDDKLIFL